MTTANVFVFADAVERQVEPFLGCLPRDRPLLCGQTKHSFWGCNLARLGLSLVIPVEHSLSPHFCAAQKQKYLTLVSDAFT